MKNLIIFFCLLVGHPLFAADSLNLNLENFDTVVMKELLKYLEIEDVKTMKSLSRKLNSNCTKSIVSLYNDNKVKVKNFQEILYIYNTKKIIEYIKTTVGPVLYYPVNFSQDQSFTFNPPKVKNMNYYHKFSLQSNKLSYRKAKQYQNLFFHLFNLYSSNKDTFNELKKMGLRVEDYSLDKLPLFARLVHIP